MKPTVSAFYQCYKQPKAFLRALTSFREYYPDGAISLISDGGGYDYSQAAHHFNCTYSRLEEHTGGVASSTVFSQRQEFIEWLMRLVNAAKASNEDYIILLEDDVVVLKEITSPLLYDINGANTKEFLGKKMEQYLLEQGIKAPLKNNRFYYGGCGGALFKRSFLLEYFSDPVEVEKIIIQYEPYREGRHLEIYSTDYWISLLTYHVGGTVGSYNGFCETWEGDYWFRKYFLKNIEVLHQAKDLYNKPLNKEEEAIIGELVI